MKEGREGTILSPERVERYESLGGQQLDFSGEMVFPAWVREQLSQPGVYTPDVVGYLKDSGLVFREIAVGNPASDKICRAMYSGGYLGWGPLDDWIGNKGQGAEKERTSCMQALINRLQVVSEWLAKFITQKYKERCGDLSCRFVVKDLGAGSGSYAFKTLGILRAQDVVPLEWVDWQCIDLSDEAMDFGRTRVVEEGYSKSVSFRKMNFMSSGSWPIDESGRADLIVLVGVLCGMTPDQAGSCLVKIVPHLRTGGDIMITTLSVLTFEENPRVCQVLVKLGWPLKPKTVKEVRAIVDQSAWGIQWVGSERRDPETGEEEPGEYVMVHAKLL